MRQANAWRLSCTTRVSDQHLGVTKPSCVDIHRTVVTSRMRLSLRHKRLQTEFLDRKISFKFFCIV